MSAPVPQRARSAGSPDVRIGTSGFSFDDWVGPFYPAGTRRSRMLEHYARHFSCLEVNATYYRIPPPRTFESLVRRTPADFRFIVKAHRSATHEPARMRSEIGAFQSAIAPVREAGKLDGVLLQFPWRFRFGQGSLDHLSRARELMPEDTLFAEFRHACWNREETFRHLRALRIGYCAVDEPDLPGLMPPVGQVTNGEAYVRFHGRNAEAWWGSTRKIGADRYDYRYTAGELREWAARIRHVAARARRTWVFFNNCHEGKAVDGARILAAMLEEEIAS